MSVFCNRRSHARLGRAGKVVAAICFVHCLLFLLLFASFTFFAVAPSNQWIHWFDNAYLHLGFGGAAVALAATHMVLHKESLSKRALLLALFGAGCLTVSVSGEFVLHSHAHTHSSGAGDHVHVHEDGTVCTDPHHHAQPSGSGSVLASAGGEHTEATVCLKEHGQEHVALHLLFMVGNVALFLLHSRLGSNEQCLENSLQS